MQKNVAGQRIGVQMVSASDGTAFTGAVTVYVTGDAGSQAIGSVGSGACTHEGNGYHSYAPAQAETNFDLIAFTFTGSGAVPVTVQVYTAINPVTAVPTAAATATAVRSNLGLTGTLDSAFDAIPTAAENGAAGWNRMLVDHTSTGSFGYVIGLLFGLLENVTGWRFTSKALEQAPSGSTTGSGARTVTITVNDGAAALQNARVRLTEGANTYTGLTNASGVVVFNVDDATYTVAVTKAGYSFAGTTLVVDGTEAVTYSMSVVTITPSNPTLVTGYYTCYSELGVVESGVTIELQVHKVPSETGLALDSAIRTAISDANGLAQFTNLVPGTTYQVRRNQGQYYTFKIADNASGSVELNSIIGT